MKLLLILAAVFLVAGAASIDENWQQFKMKHGKTYRSMLEEQRRYKTFQNNLLDIEEHNKRFARGEETYTKGITRFADLTTEEFLATLHKSKSHKTRSAKRDFFIPTGVVPATEINYVKTGLVTPVKDQGTCYSCWAFSTVGAIEGQIAKSNGSLESLSPQQLNDCGHKGGCQEGDEMENAFEWVSHNGILTEQEYPYIGYTGKCIKAGGRKISGYKMIESNNEPALMEALATVGPISINIDATAFQMYESGILNGKAKCSKKHKDLNHGVLLVGAGTENGIPYYLIKNSWSTLWGEKGYGRIKRDENICGISLKNSYPVL